MLLPSSIWTCTHCILAAYAYVHRNHVCLTTSDRRNLGIYVILSCKIKIHGTRHAQPHHSQCHQDYGLCIVTCIKMIQCVPSQTAVTKECSRTKADTWSPHMHSMHMCTDYVCVPMSDQRNLGIYVYTTLSTSHGTQYGNCAHLSQCHWDYG